MPFYTLAQAAAAWSEDRNGAFLMSFDAPTVVDPCVAPVWHLFVPAMQALADCGEDNEYSGHALWCVQAAHPALGRAMVVWASHLEGRGPCTVEVLQLLQGKREVSCGPAEGGTPGPVLAQYMAEGLWQYAGNPAEVGLLPGGYAPHCLPDLVPAFGSPEQA